MPLFGKKSEPSPRRVIYTENEMKRKLAHMTPDMQNLFVKYSEMLMHKESELFLNILADSRGEILEIGDEIKHEQEVLKAESKHLGSPQSAYDLNSSDPNVHMYVEHEEHTKKAVNEYLKAVGREMPEKQKHKYNRLSTTPTSMPSYARPVSSSSSRPTTGHRVRLTQLDGDFEDDSPSARPLTAEEAARAAAEQAMLMDQMKQQGNLIQEERERQQELILQRKADRKAKAEAKREQEANQVSEMMSAQEEAEQQQRKTKERQEQMLKERLAKKKLERRKTLQTMDTDGAVIQDQTNDEDVEDILQQSMSRSKTESNWKSNPNEPEFNDDENKPVPKVGWDDGDEAAPMEGTKKKKKSKKEVAAAADGEKKKKKKKKGATTVEGDGDAVEGAEDGEKKKKRKKKKKIAEENSVPVENDLEVSEV